MDTFDNVNQISQSPYQKQISRLFQVHRNSWYYALGRHCQTEMQELKEKCQGQDNEWRL